MLQISSGFWDELIDKQTDIQTDRQTERKTYKLKCSKIVNIYEQKINVFRCNAKRHDWIEIQNLKFRSDKNDRLENKWNFNETKNQLFL